MTTSPPIDRKDQLALHPIDFHLPPSSAVSRVCRARTNARRRKGDRSENQSRCSGPHSTPGVWTREGAEKCDTARKRRVWQKFVMLQCAGRSAIPMLFDAKITFGSKWMTCPIRRLGFSGLFSRQYLPRSLRFSLRWDSGRRLGSCHSDPHRRRYRAPRGVCSAHRQVEQPARAICENLDFPCSIGCGDRGFLGLLFSCPANLGGSQGRST